MEGANHPRLGPSRKPTDNAPGGLVIGAVYPLKHCPTNPLCQGGLGVAKRRIQPSLPLSSYWYQLPPSQRNDFGAYLSMEASEKGISRTLPPLFWSLSFCFSAREPGCLWRLSFHFKFQDSPSIALSMLLSHTELAGSGKLKLENFDMLRAPPGRRTRAPSLQRHRGGFTPQHKESWACFPGFPMPRCRSQLHEEFTIRGAENGIRMGNSEHFWEAAKGFDEQ